MHTDTGPSLVEAAPWIEKFKGRTVVIKLGGELLDSTAVLRRLARQVVTIQQCGMRVLVVHGAGRQIDQACAAANVPVNKIDGRRVTDSQTIKIVTEVLLGLSRQIADAIESCGIRTIVPTSEKWPIAAKLRGPVDVQGAVQDFGFVGDVTSFEAPPTDALPVLASLGMSEAGFLNTNADTAARCIAVAIQAHKVVYVTSVPGLYRAIEDAGPISDLDTSEAREMLASPNVTGGMRAKLQECVLAIENGVESVHIIGGREPFTILRELYTGEGCGTLIHKGDD